MKHFNYAARLLLAATMLGSTGAYAYDNQREADAAITAKVQTMLGTDEKVVARAPITVTTLNGEVNLAGQVESVPMIYRAVEITRKVEGVRKVETRGLDVN